MSFVVTEHLCSRLMGQSVTKDPCSSVFPSVCSRLVENWVQSTLLPVAPPRLPLLWTASDFLWPQQNPRAQRKGIGGWMNTFQASSLPTCWGQSPI